VRWVQWPGLVNFLDKRLTQIAYPEKIGPRDVRLGRFMDHAIDPGRWVAPPETDVLVSPNTSLKGF
jgi:hypothetical protein